MEDHYGWLENVPKGHLNPFLGRRDEPGEFVSAFNILCWASRICQVHRFPHLQARTYALHFKHSGR